MQEVLEGSNDLTIQISHTFESTNGIPNQSVMAVFLQKVLNKLKQPIKLGIIANEPKLLNMVRYEIVKLEGHTVKQFVKDKDAP